MQSGKPISFAPYRKYSHCFIETGTGRLGGITEAFWAGFTHVKSIEACEEYYRQNEEDILKQGWKVMGRGACHVRFTKDKLTLDLYKGMSQDCLPMALEDIQSTVVFWLDAHVSGPCSAGHADYELKGNKSDYAQHNVLTKELQIITKHRPDHVILMDDQNGPTVENAQYIEHLSRVNPRYQFTFYDEIRGEIKYKNKVLACEVV